MSMPGPSPQEAFVQGRIINLVRSGRARTRPELELETGLGRKVVHQRVQTALAAGLLADGELTPSGGGRPSRSLRFCADAGHVFAGVIGAEELTAAVADLDGNLKAKQHLDWNSSLGPDATMEHLDEMFVSLARRTGTRPWGFGIGVAGPVDFGSGRLVDPPIMPGWDDYSVRSWLRERYDAPVWVDNDVNLMALGEWHRGRPADGRDLLYIFLDTGIGGGLISRGKVFRGDSGAAGDIGHIQVTEDPTILCRCGRTGCLEAVAGGWSIARRLTAHASESPVLTASLRGREALSAGDIATAFSAGDPLTLTMLHTSAATVGTTTANLVNFANPGTVVIGGGALRLGDEFFAELEHALRHRTTALAGRHLTVRRASLDHTEGVVGAAILAVEHLFDPDMLGLWAPSGSPLGFAAPLQKSTSGSISA